MRHGHVPSLLPPKHQQGGDLNGILLPAQDGQIAPHAGMRAICPGVTSRIDQEPYKNLRMMRNIGKWSAYSDQLLILTYTLQAFQDCSLWCMTHPDRNKLIANTTNGETLSMCQTSKLKDCMNTDDNRITMCSTPNTATTLGSWPGQISISTGSDICTSEHL